ncbi:MAG: DUF2630 family protein [Actinobacteria bacterium]|nr:MAG: DUF2630 family protein [Actinomycetota bacterium]
MVTNSRTSIDDSPGEWKCGWSFSKVTASSTDSVLCPPHPQIHAGLRLLRRDVHLLGGGNRRAIQHQEPRHGSSSLRQLRADATPSSARRASRVCRERLLGWGRNRVSAATVGAPEEGAAVDDKEVLSQINKLAEKEHELFRKEAEAGVTDEERAELRKLEVTLDQCWDLLHQRRARRAAGLDPDSAKVRDANTVEKYIG